MKRTRRFRIWLLALAASVLMGCAEEGPYDYGSAYPPPPYGYYEYYYYPDVEVYYYPHRHVYWWSEHGEWRSGRRVPPNIELREHVRVNLDSREPWRHHEEIRQRYPARRHEAPRPQAPRRELPGGGEH